MQKKFLHLFLSNNLVTALLIRENDVEILFSSAEISNPEKVLKCLLSYHALPIRLIIDTVNVSIKTFDTTGMNWWHKYELRQRLNQESLSSDWYCLWQQEQKLIALTGAFSETEHSFLKQLITQNFLIEHAVPSLWILNQTLLKGHQIQKVGIVQIPLQNSFQQILYLNGVPTTSRISKDENVVDWIQFIQMKYKINIDVLEARRLITSLGNANDSYETYISKQLIHKTSPKISFSKKIPLGKYYQKFNFLKQLAQGTCAAAAVAAIVILPYIISTRTDNLKLLALIDKEKSVLEALPVHPQQPDLVKNYLDKQNIMESFYQTSFPIMFFLEKISKILPDYGQVIFVRVVPPISKFTANSKDVFSIHLKIVPFKNSKDLKLLTTELHKVFGADLRIHIINSPIKGENKEAAVLTHTVQINMTGLIHEIQKLKH